MRTYKDFVRASSNYLSRADENALSIHYDITIGCWVYFDAESTGVATGIISKWYETGIARSYVIYKDASNVIHFKVSENGLDEYDITDYGTNYAEETWFYIVGRFTVGYEMGLFVNGMWYKQNTSLPAWVFNSDEDFEMGRYNRDNYLDGRISQAFICAYSVPDVFICSMYYHAKALYMDKFSYVRPCSSSTTSSSSTTITSSSSTSTSSSSSSSTTSSSSSSVIP